MTITLKVDGMMCVNCASHVKKALEGAGGQNVEVDLKAGKATLEAAGDISAALIQAVKDAGYEAELIK